MNLPKLALLFSSALVQLLLLLPQKYRLVLFRQLQHLELSHEEVV